MDNSKIAIIDIETTGLEPNFCKIVELAIVELDYDLGSIETLFNNVIWEKGFIPNRDQHAWIFYNSTLTIDDVKNAKSLEEYRTKIQRILNHYGITSYNKDFDFGILEKRSFEIKQEFPCIMKTATEILQIPHYSHGYKYPTLTESWYHFFPQKTYFESHRALDDAEKTAKILFDMISKGDYSPKAREYTNPYYNKLRGTT